MAVELVTDPEEPGYNSFVSLEDAEEYYAGVYFGAGTPWEDLEEEDQARLLVTASRALSTLNWTGVLPEGQVLAFPRSYTTYEYGYATDPVTPSFVKVLTLEYARWLWQEGDRLMSDVDLSNIQSASIEGLSVTLRDGATSSLPPGILALLTPLSPAYVLLGNKARSVSMWY